MYKNRRWEEKEPEKFKFIPKYIAIWAINLSNTKTEIGIAANKITKLGDLILNESGHGGIYNFLLQIAMMLVVATAFVLIKLSVTFYWYLILIIPLWVLYKACSLYSEKTAITLICKPADKDYCSNCDQCKHRNNS